MYDRGMGFELLFQAGRRFTEGVVQPRAAGNVQLPTGRIVVGDPRALARQVMLYREFVRSVFLGN